MDGGETRRDRSLGASEEENGKMLFGTKRRWPAHHSDARRIGNETVWFRLGRRKKKRCCCPPMNGPGLSDLIFAASPQFSSILNAHNLKFVFENGAEFVFSFRLVCFRRRRLLFFPFCCLPWYLLDGLSRGRKGIMCGPTTKTTTTKEGGRRSKKEKCIKETQAKKERSINAGGRP